MSRRPPFPQQLVSAWVGRDSLLCVGLDPIPERFPRGISRDAAGCLEFCQRVADAVGDLVCAFKPQFAHFAALGAERELAQLIAYLHACHPDVPVILDAKRGDIGSTAQRYAEEAFVRYDADAVTVNPFLGPESLAPFLAWQDRGVVVLCRTSNPDSAWLQGGSADTAPAYLKIAAAAAEWNRHGNVMLVTGATYPEELGRIRAVAPRVAFLVPGIGSQGGDLEAALAAGVDADGRGLVVNVARDVLYAAQDDTFECAARNAAARWRERIEAARSKNRIKSKNHSQLID